MIKKSGVSILILLIVLSITLVGVRVQAQDPSNILGEDTAKHVKQIQDFAEGAQKAGEGNFTSINDTLDKAKQSTGNYLRQEWEKTILKTKFGRIYKIISDFFKEIKIAFRIIFGEPFSFTWAFLVIVFLWHFVYRTARIFFNVNLKFSLLISILLGVLAAILLANIGIYRAVIVALDYIVFKRETAWLRYLMTAIIVAGFIALHHFSKVWTQKMAKEKEEKEKEEQKNKVEKLETRYKAEKEGQDSLGR